MSKDKKTNDPSVGEEIQVAIGKTEAFIEKYQKQLIYAVLGIVIVVSGVILFSKFYQGPREVEAQNQLSKSQNYFVQDSFKLALNGDGIDSRGLKRIIEDYGSTKSANLANVYAGICCYKLGDYNQAISYLEEFDGNDDVNITPTVVGLIGDAYVELRETDKALTYFTKAYEMDNKMLSPVFLKKAGLVYESKGEYDKAIELYTQIKDKYVQSNEARDIEKYIERAKASK